MINTKDVTILKIPYPDVLSPLFSIPHMYICIKTSEKDAYLIKCQSFKPYHSRPDSVPKSRLTEYPDIKRNPFVKATVIDLDKQFSASRSLGFRLLSPISDTFLSDIHKNMPSDIQVIPIIPKGL